MVNSSWYSCPNDFCDETPGDWHKLKKDPFDVSAREGPSLRTVALFDASKLSMWWFIWSSTWLGQRIPRESLKIPKLFGCISGGVSGGGHHLNQWREQSRWPHPLQGGWHYPACLNPDRTKQQRKSSFSFCLSRNINPWDLVPTSSSCNPPLLTCSTFSWFCWLFSFQQQVWRL